jgi:uncharacterized protein YbbC (DUF1343 family)
MTPKLGIDTLLTDQTSLLDDKKVGVLAHQASLTSKGQPIIPALLSQKNCSITTLFGPEHGLMTQAQDMEAVSSKHDKTANLPIYSLYGDSYASLKPTADMLANIDILVIDLQDIGTRYYTYIWTTLLCMEACAQHHKKVIVCDRPNPLNGITTEGPGIEPGFESFVGLHSIPIRHGKTIGELAGFVNQECKIGCDLNVLSLRNWDRHHYWDETGLTWINPSPNMRSLNAAIVYPGMCLLEATNVSEGRGSDTPFEIFGAPFIEADVLAQELSHLDFEGLEYSPIAFTPTHQKWAGQECQGLQWTISNREILKPYQCGLTLIETLYRLYKDKGFAWRQEPYEFVQGIPAIDLLTGSHQFRKKLEATY